MSNTASKRAWLSPINQRRWANFKANRRGYISLWIFLVLFIITLFAEFIANDRPIVVKYQDEFLFPVFVDYPETRFGGFLPNTNYRFRFVQDSIKKNGWAIWPPIRYGVNTVNDNLPEPPLSKPFWMYDAQMRCQRYPAKTEDPDCHTGNFNWLGSDANARDVLARAIYGFRISVLFGLLLTLFASVIGVTAGALQGYFGGWADLIGQRLVEIWTSIPILFVVLIMASLFVPNFWILLAIMTFFYWTSLVGVVRAEFLRARNLEYVTAARALGVGNLQIMVRHLLPNAMVATLTFIPFILSSSITLLTSLDFLGFGLPPGSASLGELMKQGKDNISAPWLGITGFVVISVMLSLLIFVGEAVRDAFDPRKTFQ